MPYQSTRRSFLGRATILAAAAAAPTLCRGTGDEPLPILDTHQHLRDLKRFRLPWLDRAGDVLNRTHTPDDYAKAAEGLNVVQAVYMEVAVAAEQRVEEAEYVIDLCRRKVGVTVAAVIAGEPESEQFGAYIARFKDSPYVKGVRSPFEAGANSERFVKNLRGLGELRLSYDINTGPDGLGRAADVVRQCPDTRLVLDHCGNVDASAYRKGATDAAVTTRRRWERGIAELAEREHVVCKVSGVIEAVSAGSAGIDEYAAVVNHCLDRFGPDRVIFASNWPVVNRGGSFPGWVEVVRQVTKGRAEIERRKLFHDNAMRFYGLD
jgi:predicted TIM-barrel fold metal-dependent hydrolase